jgi:hypothetical protein
MLDNFFYRLVGFIFFCQKICHEKWAMVDYLERYGQEFILGGIGVDMQRTKKIKN